MKMRLHYAFLVLFVFLVSSCGEESLDNTYIIESENAITVEKELLEIINNHRLSIDHNPFIYSTVAYKHANLHTDYMISKGDINHDNFSTRASNVSAEVDAIEVSENVAKNYKTARIAFENWLKSTTHRKSIEGNYTHTAISVKKDNNGEFYFTELFYK
ncbi:CAP domain-containing protein [Cellulophaga sp. HaHaR_3_176]|uniref:CAP domain-containing protein n=1 Tax=Cellulophaga sp. HaHaR_3_176 TaxID=1942464 RepID=UPI001C1FF24C|nr:CAP domain-containing protein [Cellulophaga sp. HaHaR_3_176]QWX83418.1 CAP domain-containing protein [Cellulophaga sp. HaHaR_3_176]